jgi:ribonuclease R
MERIADACARETQEIKLVEYMARYVGQTLHGIVSGVTSYGLYVRLDTTCEGFLPVRFLGFDYFTLDAQRHRLVGQDTNRSYRLGQPLRVIVHDAPAHARKLDLRLA